MDCTTRPPPHPGLTAEFRRVREEFVAGRAEARRPKKITNTSLGVRRADAEQLASLPIMEGLDQVAIDRLVARWLHLQAAKGGAA